ncbi:MAG: tetratricopeptide repeat protein, partial [Alphaproteobacteria bacterium]|nr:tetratricopeptide repeat protein [Alphaproteobacteria bacterium]
MSNTDESLFREVDEEVRQDEYKKVWDRYGKHFTTLAIVLVAGVAAFQGWRYYQDKQAQDAGTVYFDALKKAADGKTDDALSALAVVKHAGFGQLAALEQAALLAKKGETDKAVAAYDAFAADAKSDPALADLARIRAGYVLADTATPDQLLPRLGKFDKDGAVWRQEAREIFGLAAWRVKDYVMADRYMQAVFADAEASPAMRQ